MLVGSRRGRGLLEFIARAIGLHIIFVTIDTSILGTMTNTKSHYRFSSMTSSGAAAHRSYFSSRSYRTIIVFAAHMVCREASRAPSEHNPTPTRFARRPSPCRGGCLPLRAAPAYDFLLPYAFGFAWLCMPANGEGAGAPFCLFLSCLGFFFSLLLRIWPFAMASSGLNDSKADGAM